MIPPVSAPGSTWGHYPSGDIHRAIDYAVPIGTPVRAPDAGIITTAGWSVTGFGWHVRIHSDVTGDTIILGHLSQINVRVGQHVAQGEVVGKSGSSGRSTGPHVHMEVRHFSNDPNSSFDFTGQLGKPTTAGPNIGAGIQAGLAGLPAFAGLIPGVAQLGGVAITSGGGVLGGLDAIGAFFGALGQRNTWVRVLQVVGGVALVIGGVVIVGKGTIADVAIQAVPGGQAVRTAVKSVAK